MTDRFTREEFEWLLAHEENLRDLFGQKRISRAQFCLIREMLLEPKGAYMRAIRIMGSPNKWNVSNFLSRLERLGYVKVEEKKIVIRKNKEITFVVDG